MAEQLPDGVDSSDVLNHGVNLILAAQVVNATSAYLSAEDFSPEEVEAEGALTDLAGMIADDGKERAVQIVLLLASVLVQTAPEEAVQQWFDEHVAHATKALGDD